MMLTIRNLSKEDLTHIEYWVRKGFSQQIRGGEMSVEWIHNMCHVMEQINEQMEDERNV